MLEFVDIKEDGVVGSSLKTSSGMTAVKTREIFQFGSDNIKRAASSGGITSKEPTCIDRNSLLLTTKCRLV